MSTKSLISSPVVGIEDTVSYFSSKCKLDESSIVMNESTETEAHTTYLNVRRSLSSFGRSFEQPFQTFYCKFSGNIMEDPVMTCCESVYERKVITKWFQDSRAKNEPLVDPCTKQILVNDTLTPVTKLKQMISEWKERKSLACIVKAREVLISGDEESRIKTLKGLLDACSDTPMGKSWIAYEGLLPVMIECLNFRSLDVKKCSFRLLKVMITDHEKNTEAISLQCIEMAARSLIRNPPVVEAAEFLEQLVKTQHGQTLIEQTPKVISAFVACAQMEPLKHIIEAIFEIFSRNDILVIKMAESNWYPPLLERLAKGSHETQLMMISFLVDMCLTKESAEFFLKNNIISILSGILESEDCNLLRVAAVKALHKFSLQDVAMDVMIKEGVLSIILEILSCKGSDSSRLAASIVLERLSLKCSLVNVVQIYGQSILEQLVANVFSLLGNLTLPLTSSSIHVNLLRVLYTLSSQTDSFEFKNLIRREQGCFEVLHYLLKPHVPEVCVLALNLLCILFDGKEGKELAASAARNVQPFMVVLQDSSASLETQVAVAKVISKLPNIDPTHINLNAVSILLGLYNGIHTQSEALEALLLFINDPSVQHFLADNYVISKLVFQLDHPSSSLKSRAAMALRLFSLGSLSRPTKQTMAFRKPCPVHNGHCKVKKNFCIVKAGAVPKLVNMLDDSNNEVVEAAVDALSTLLLTNTMSNAVYFLEGHGLVDKLLDVVTRRSIICSQKGLDLLEKLFCVPEIKSKYESKAKTTLSALLGCEQSQNVSRKAMSLLTELRAC